MDVTAERTTTDQLKAPQVRWARTADEMPWESGFQAVATDAMGNVYAIGYCAVPETHQSGYQGILVKYDALGSVRWIRCVESAEAESTFTSLAIDHLGNVYVVGFFTSQATGQFGDVSFQGTSPGKNAMIAKIRASGTVEWVKLPSEPTSAASTFCGVAVGPGGQIFAAGSVFGAGTCTWDQGIALHSGCRTSAGLVVHFHPDGTASWVRSVESEFSSSYFKAVTFANGGPCVVGYLWGQGPHRFDQDCSTTVSADAYSAVIVHYDSEGRVDWMQTPNRAPSGCHFHGVTSDPSGNYIAVGCVYGTEEYAWGTRIFIKGAYAQGDNFCLVKFDRNGTPIWSQTATEGHAPSFLRGVRTDGLGNIYASGYLYGDGRFDLGNEVYVRGAFDGHNPLMVEYTPSGRTLWAQTTEKSGAHGFFTGVSPDSRGVVYASGVISGTGVFDFGQGNTLRGVTNGPTFALVRYDPRSLS